MQNRLEEPEWTRSSSLEAIPQVQTRDGGALDSYDGGGRDGERSKWIFREQNQ